MTTELEGKGSPYAERLGEYTAAAMRDRHNFRKQRDTLQEIVRFVYHEAHAICSDPEPDSHAMIDALEAIEDKIESFSEEDIGDLYYIQQ